MELLPNRSSVGTLVERTSRKLVLVKLADAKAETARDGFAADLLAVPAPLRLTLTYDQGIASSDHHLERMIVTREDGEAVWAERRLDQAAWAVVRPVRSAFQFHGSRQSS